MYAFFIRKYTKELCHAKDILVVVCQKQGQLFVVLLGKIFIINVYELATGIFILPIYTKKCFDAFLLVVFEAQKRLYRGKLLKDIEYLHITEGVFLLIFLVFIL